MVWGANRLVGGPGVLWVKAYPAAVERNQWVPIREKRIQITGALVLVPSQCVDRNARRSDNPLYYIYTTFRREFALFSQRGVTNGDS